jgi:fatty-acyl-CoA synthase
LEFNVAAVHEAIAERIPERDCIVYGDRRLSWGQVTERTRRLANFLLSQGFGKVRERSELAGWESGQDHLALYLYNGNEYLEGMLGAYKARTAPFNVNYRYVEEELLYLLRDSAARGIVYHAGFGPTLAKIRGELPKLELLLQVEDGSGAPLLEGAWDYEVALASASAARPAVEWSPDDLYILYTGGTTGMPKGVLWRQADVFVGAFGGRGQSLEEIAERARERGGLRVLPAPPFMHGAAHWSAFANFNSGHCVVIQRETRKLDPRELLETAAREKVVAMLIVGDAFGRPLLDEMRRHRYDLSKLRYLITGGAALNTALKSEFLELLPDLSIIDSIGSSESGTQGQLVSTRASGVATGTFEPSSDTRILSEDLTRVLEPGHSELGWFAKTGRVPLGYLGDAAKTARTFPSIDGVRYSVPGDRARQRADGIIEVHGRDSVTTNSGGEKIFAEEVEHALKAHPAVQQGGATPEPVGQFGRDVIDVGIVLPLHSTGHWHHIDVAGAIDRQVLDQGTQRLAA